MSSRAAIRTLCEDEGIAIMADVFDIILDRGEIEAEVIMEWLEDDSTGPYTVYEDYIVRGINRLEDDLRGEVE